MELGKIENVDIRTQWDKEEYDFTPWLAREDNIQILADAINLDLEIEDTEVFIASWRGQVSQSYIRCA